MDPVLAMIFMFGGNFAPFGYAFCSGQTVAISTNAALFSLLGTTYGGNGVTTFQLPDLRGRAPIGQGQGLGLSNYVLGQIGGTENTTLLQSNLPMHNHLLNVNTAAGTTGTPGTTTYLSQGPSTGSGPNATIEKIYTTNATNTNLAPNTIGMAGGSTPFSIMQPYLAINYVIATQGVFPSRN